MKKPLYSGVAVLIFIFLFFVARSNDTDSISVFRSGNTINLVSPEKTCRIEVCSPSMVRVRLACENGLEADEHWMVERYEWPEVDYSFTETKEDCRIETDLLHIVIRKAPFAIAFYDKYGRVINQDLAGDESSMSYKEGRPECTKMMMPCEHFFGFGERMDFIDQLGKKVELNVGRGTGRTHETGAYNILEANYSPVPFFLSTNGYGIFFHNSFRTVWDMGYSASGRYSFSAAGGELDYYFLYGPSFNNIIGEYTALTGRSPLLPRFAMGLHVGTYSGGTWGHEDLTSQYYVIELARKFRQLGIPVDMLHLDSTWRIFGKINGKGGTSFEWRQPGFPDPKEMFDSLYAMHYKMVGLHIRPRIDNGDTHNYLDQARALGYTYPENGKPGNFLNFFDTAAVDWWWNVCLKPLAELGCKFVKTDEGSAFGHLANESNKMGPQGKEIQKLHNIFPIAYARAPFLKFQKYNGIRGLNHTREGYAGIQRYPFIFAGDWPSEWQYFRPVIRAGINISLSGIGAWTHCMGGFEHVADPELYIRWCQFGMFSPIALLFGMEHPEYKEPWRYGDDALEIFTRYDKLRYRLIPYIYSCYYQMYKTGAPVMQALVLQYPGDPNTYTIDDQYFFGEDILVCPVTVKGAKTRIVYLPGGNWYDYWTGKKITGGRYLNIVTPLETLPLYVREGAIIPMQPEMDYTGEKPENPLTLDIYPSDISVYDLYEDDGLTLNYQKGIYAITKITCRKDDISNATYIEIHSPEGEYEVHPKSIILLVHSDNRPAAVTLNKKQVSELTRVDEEIASPGLRPAWSYDADKKVIFINCNQEAGKNLLVNIVF